MTRVIKQYDMLECNNQCKQQRNKQTNKQCTNTTKKLSSKQAKNDNCNDNDKDKKSTTILTHQSASTSQDVLISPICFGNISGIIICH